MIDLATQAQPAVDKLLPSDDDVLFVELANRVQAMQHNPAIGGTFDPNLPVLESLGVVDDLKDFGQRFFDRLSKEAYNLVCGAEAEHTEERQNLIAAFGLGKEAVAATLAATLVGYLGLAPAVAAVVAALAIRLFFRPAYGATCDVWKEKLQAQAA